MDDETAQIIMQSTETLKTGSDNEVGGYDDGIIVISGRKWKSKPAPFLRKIYELVSDPQTDSFISWNSTGTGFIIWDHNKFSAQILPTLFKTSNFSSFIYQLNNYGFKKISWERYEYANQWFQLGKKHWLKNMVRRNQNSEYQSRRKRARYTPDHAPINPVIEAKLEAIMTEQNDIKSEFQKLRQNLDHMNDQITRLEIPKLPELNKDEKMNIDVFRKQLMDYLRKKKAETSDGNSKKPSLDATEKIEKSFSSADVSEISVQEEKVKKTTENAQNSQFWKKIMDDDADDAGFDSNGGRGDLGSLYSEAILEFDEMMASNIAMQSESLITNTKPSDLDVEDDCHLDLWT